MRLVEVYDLRIDIEFQRTDRGHGAHLSTEEGATLHCPIVLLSLGMDKGLRHQIKIQKYKRRLKRIGLYSAETIANPKGENYNLTGFRNHSNPCSCFVCSHKKYKRNNPHSIINEGLQEFEQRYDESIELEEPFDDDYY